MAKAKNGLTAGPWPRPRPGSGRRCFGLLAVFVVGCASGGPVISDGGAPGPVERVEGAAQGMGQGQDRQEPMVPAGHGTLHQDEITVQLRRAELLVKVTPLDEATIRLLAPDTYNRLHAIAESRAAEAREGAFGEPELFLVSFFSYQPDVAFTPEDVQISQQGQLERAHRIVPLSNGWGKQRLAQQETQTAVYAFDIELDYDQPMGVRYGLQASEEWGRIVSLLQEERAKVRARASGG